MKHLLSLTAGALAALSLMAQDSLKAPSPADKLGWQLAVHSYTFQKFSIFDAIDKTAAVGVKYMSVSGGMNLEEDGKIKRVETPALSDADFAAIQARLKAKGIHPQFVNMGVVKPTTDEAQSRKIFEAAKRFGIPVLVAEPETHNKMEELPKVMDVVEKLAKEYNIKVAIHNHPGPQNFYWKPETVLAAVQGRSPLLGACPDVGHYVRSGLDPVECLKKLEGRVIALHFKDLNEKSPKAHDVPWGTGISNARGMMAELKRQGFKGAFCVEYEYNWDNSSPEIAECAKFFNATAADLANEAPRGADAKPSAVEATIDATQVAQPMQVQIYSQFIEHLGRCIYGGIWAQMLEDRKFYFPITADYNPYRKLTNSPFPVVGASPWQIMGPGDAVKMAKDGPFVGEHTPCVKSGSGIAQHDLGVVAGKKYVGYIWLKAADGSPEVTVSFTPGTPGADAHQFSGISATHYHKFDFEFTAAQTTDKASLSIKVDGGDALVGAVSLMPADNVRGMRADTLALLKQLGAPQYRWPGGNFVSGYDWRDGIGDRDRRPPRKNPAWTGVEHNDFGLDEFLGFCHEVGAAPVVAVNTGFGDAYSAAQEVEYCNASPDTVGGSWRAKNGRHEPYGVKLWCVGNEMFGNWQLGYMDLKQYVLKHNEVARYMLQVDPSIKLIGVGSLADWSKGMLEECASRMDYISRPRSLGAIRKRWTYQTRQSPAQRDPQEGGWPPQAPSRTQTAPRPPGAHRHGRVELLAQRLRLRRARLRVRPRRRPGSRHRSA
ncbi:MAG: TIM barrel protein [Verrucomicrobia bacterium]|nr:TIM barrel protein [Verrucomicrobiota bacterium]